MKTTETYEQLLERFTKRIKQISVQTPANTVEAEKISGQLHYLRGCKETIEYLMTGQLPMTAIMMAWHIINQLNMET